MQQGDVLFARGDLAQYLQGQVSAVDSYVESAMSDQDAEIETDTLVARLLPKALVAPLKIDFEAPTKSVSPTRVPLRDFGRDIEVDGLLVSWTFPFEGEPELFGLQPSTFTTMLPYGRAGQSHLVIGVRSSAEPSEIKAQLESAIRLIQTYVDWQWMDISKHNEKLPSHLRRQIEQRKARLAQLMAARELLG